MPKKQSKLERFQADIAALHSDFPEDLRLPSLREARLEGFAALFMIVLPLLDSLGQVVFSDEILFEVFRVLDQRFGGCLVPSSTSHPPYWGLWQPTVDADALGEKDYVTTIQIFANPIEPTNRFFIRLKKLLKDAAHVEQQEILVSRIDCRLL